MPTLEELLQESTAFHRHLCPRQVLGVRIGLYGGHRLGLGLRRDDKRLLTFVETDGCAADGVSVATGCRVGGRTLRVVDFGKVAATFVDTVTGCAVRVSPAHDIRERVWAYAPTAKNKWQAQLLGYQRMPDEELMVAQSVVLTVSLEQLMSKPGYRVNCHMCGEEIMNEREVVHENLVLCRACAGDSYCQPVVELASAVAEVR